MTTSGDGPPGGQPAPASIHQVVNRTQLNWSNERTPVVTVKSGAELTLAVPDASGGQIDAGSE